MLAMLQPLSGRLPMAKLGRLLCKAACRVDGEGYVPHKSLPQKTPDTEPQSAFQHQYSLSLGSLGILNLKQSGVL